jgi:predicted SAM-dependent methyltransferase
VTDSRVSVLDMGCGRSKIPGALGMDVDPQSQADIIHDLNQYPYPVKENTFDQIFAKHIIEHLDNPRGFLKEVHRILKPGGVAFIETPHFSCRVAYSEPEHKLFYSYYMFVHLLSDLAKINYHFKVLRQEITFYKLYKACGIKFLANKFPDTYERFWTYMFPAENVVLEVKKEV